MSTKANKWSISRPTCKTNDNGLLATVSVDGHLEINGHYMFLDDGDRIVGSLKMYDDEVKVLRDFLNTYFVEE